MAFGDRLLKDALAAGADSRREPPVVMGMPVIARTEPPHGDIELRFNLSEFRDRFTQMTLGEVCRRHGKGTPYFSAKVTLMDMKLTRDIDDLMSQVVKNAERSAQGMMSDLMGKSPSSTGIWTDTIDATAFGDNIRQQIPVKRSFADEYGVKHPASYNYTQAPLSNSSGTKLDPELENRLYRKHREAERKQREAEEQRRVQEMADEIVAQEELEGNDLFGEWA